MQHENYGSTELPEQVDTERIRVLGRAIRRKRIIERLTLERAAEQSGVSAATLSRLERQGDAKTKANKSFITPDTRTITALTYWLGVSLDALSNDGEEKLPQPMPNSVAKAVSTPEAVELYLRADRNLTSERAGALAEMFRLAYQQFSQLDTPKQAEEAPVLTNDKDD